MLVVCNHEFGTELAIMIATDLFENVDCEWSSRFGSLAPAIVSYGVTMDMTGKHKGRNGPGAGKGKLA